MFFSFIFEKVQTKIKLKKLKTLELDSPTSECNFPTRSPSHSIETYCVSRAQQACVASHYQIKQHSSRTLLWPRRRMTK